jgi:endonuclease/exonuclease/phosphatase (EEP) superfamily protein YafD
MSISFVRAALTIFYVALTVLNLASFAGYWHWAADLLSHFRLYFTVLTAGSLLVIVIQRCLWRQWRAGSPLALLMLLLLAVNSHEATVLYRHAAPGPAASVALASPASVPGQPPALRVLSFNAWLPNNDAERLQALIKHENPDIVFLAEMSDTLHRSMDGLRQTYPYQFPPLGQNWTGLALFSRYPWQNAERLALGGTVFAPVLRATVATPAGAVTVIGLHTTSPMSKARWQHRNAELANLTRHVSGLKGPVIVMGDFNATVWSPAMQDLIATSGLHPVERKLVPVVTWPDWMPAVLRIPIDHIMVSSDIAPLRFWSAEAAGSDHLPIVADVVMHR